MAEVPMVKKSKLELATTEKRAIISLFAAIGYGMIRLSSVTRQLPA
jgi:hypothetical protein